MRSRSQLWFNEGFNHVRPAPTSPRAKLEPTSLVLATGVDVFGCRHTPSGAFDLIADDFNYALLLLLLLGLSVGALLLRKAAQAKNLAIQWV